MKNGEYELVLAPENYPGKKYRNKYCSKHVLIYWQTYGIIPKEDEIIHHIDGNKKNNNPDNLKLLSIKDHVSEHIHQHGRKLVELKCPNCGINFIRPKNNSFLQKSGRYNCCCKQCANDFLRLPKEEKEERIKNVFIREFTDDIRKYNLI